MQLVVKSLEQTVSKIHIYDWVDAFWEVDTSWELTISSSPLVLNTFHVPLVDHSNNSLLWAGVNVLEKVLVSSVNKNALEFWEENIEGLDEPIYLVCVKALFRKLTWL